MKTESEAMLPDKKTVKTKTVTKPTMGTVTLLYREDLVARSQISQADFPL